jgi:hypothetical protein
MTAVDYVALVVDALNRAGIPYMAVGSFSSNIYGYPRSTKDADFVIELGGRSISGLAAELGQDFALEEQMSFETVTGTMRYRLVHRTSTFVVELFLLSSDPHDQARFARRVTGDIGGRKTFFPTAEDVVVTKLRWSRHGRRQKDIDDVRNVLAVQAGKLDLDYVRRWTDQHGTRSLLEQLLSEPPS